MIIKSVEILNRLVGEGNWITIANLDYDTIVLQDGIQMPSREDFNRVRQEVEVEHSNQQYKEQRAPEYPSIGDQLDALFHAGVFPPEMAAKIQAIKDKYPKP